MRWELQDLVFFFSSCSRNEHVLAAWWMQDGDVYSTEASCDVLRRAAGAAAARGSGPLPLASSSPERERERERERGEGARATCCDLEYHFVNAKSVDSLNKCSSQDACTENEEDA